MSTTTILRSFQETLATLTPLTGHAPPPQAATRLADYVLALEDYNRVHRVVGAMSADQIARDLVLDCLGLWPLVRSPLVDVGSGAGLPGVVLKILEPALVLTLVEPRHKPAAFVSLMRAQLKLGDLKQVDRRAEEVQIADLSGGLPAQTLVAKGFGALGRLLPAGGHLLAPDGVAMVPSGSADCEVPGATSTPHLVLPGRHVHRAEARLLSG